MRFFSFLLTSRFPPAAADNNFLSFRDVKQFPCFFFCLLFMWARKENFWSSFEFGLKEIKFHRFSHTYDLIIVISPPFHTSLSIATHSQDGKVLLLQDLKTREWRRHNNTACNLENGKLQKMLKWWLCHFNSVWSIKTSCELFWLGSGVAISSRFPSPSLFERKLSHYDRNFC